MHGGRSFDGEVASCMTAWGEGVVAVVEHELGEAAHGCLDAEVGEHGDGLPAAEELDVILVDAGHQASGCAPWAERAATEAGRGDAQNVLNVGRGKAQGFRDELGLDSAPASVVGMVVVVTVDWSVRRGVGLAQA